MPASTSFKKVLSLKLKAKKVLWILLGTCTLEPGLSLKRKVLHSSLEARKREYPGHTRFQVGDQQVQSAADLGHLNKGRLEACILLPPGSPGHSEQALGPSHRLWPPLGREHSMGQMRKDWATELSAPPWPPSTAGPWSPQFRRNPGLPGG